jgi:WhiB family redox-sensing transcriptional regulator
MNNVCVTGSDAVNYANLVSLKQQNKHVKVAQDNNSRFAVSHKKELIMLDKQYVDKFWALPDWHTHAACRGMDLNVFFPEYNGGEKAFGTARKICAQCPVIAECLDQQLNVESFEDQWGMFGGMTPRERKQIRYKRDRNL